MARVTQQLNRINGTAAPSWNVTPLPAAGNCVLVFWFSWATVAHTHDSLADNKGSTVTRVTTGTLQFGSGTDRGAGSLWIIENAGTITGTWTFTGAVSTAADNAFEVIEYTNVPTSSVVDQVVQSAPASTASPSATLPATGTAYDTIVAGFNYLATTTTITEDVDNLPGNVGENEDNSTGVAINVSERFVGATGTYTANWALGAARVGGIIAVALKESAARPFLRSYGTGAAAASGNVTPTVGTHSANDILLCVIHSSDNVASTMPAGWAVVPASGTGGEALEANNTTAMRATVFWKRTAGGESNPLVTHTAGGPIAARIYAFGGVNTSGTPFSNTRLSPNAASATVTADAIVPAAANDLAVFTIHYEDDPTTCSEPVGWHDAGLPFTTALGTDAMIHLFFRPVASTASLTPSTVVSGGTFANSVNAGTTITLPKAATGGAALAGQADGTSTAAASALTLTHALAGASTGASTAAVTTLRLDHPLAGAATGTSTASAAALGLTHPLAGASAGTSTAAAPALTQTQPLAGVSGGVSTATASALTLTQALAGTADGTSSASADLSAAAGGAVLAGQSDGTSSATGTALHLDHPLAAAATGDSTAAASALTLSHPLAGQSAGASTADATTLRLLHPLAATVAGDSTAAATALRLDHPLAGQADGVGTAAGSALTATQPLAGAADGTSSAAGSALTQTQPFAGSATGVSTAAGDLTAPGPFVVILVAPAEGASGVTAPATFRWTPVTDPSARNAHFRIEVAADGQLGIANEADATTMASPAGFEYESSPGTWTAFPVGGLAVADQGKDVRSVRAFTSANLDWRVAQYSLEP